MSKYFGIFADSGDVQTALNESALTKPYVAIVSGALDYNTFDQTTVSSGQTEIDYDDPGYDPGMWD